ncbi:tripeptidyl-peptidase [Aureococcus anophagefferens]|nr:tripeptidyl-peptidase [Aureococcus anophagefferens]
MEAAARRRTRALAAVAGACVLGALALSRVASQPKDAVVALSAASQPKETAAALSAAFGGDTDAEGCYTDAGYSWCAASSSCAHPEWATHASRILSYLDVHGKQFGEAVAYGSADEAARRGFLRAEVSVASAEELLGGEYYEFAGRRPDGDAFATAPDLASSGYAPTIEGPNRGNRPGAEANLDVQYASAVSGGVPLEVWSFAGMSPDRPAINEPFLEFVLYMNGVDHAPSVVSTSYGEDEDRRPTPTPCASSTSSGWRRCGGMSLIFAAGDSGVASTWGSCDHFYAQWPAASPYVTAVGATVGFGAKTQVADFSSGGFSNRWARPDYQRAAVETYLSDARDVLVPYVAHGRLPADLFNRSGRAFPDVAAAGEDFAIIYDREAVYVSGDVLGFLNPLIYKYRAAFDDVLLGNNGKCGTDGFRALEGWDPASGFGTPDYAALLEVALAV